MGAPGLRRGSKRRRVDDVRAISVDDLATARALLATSAPLVEERGLTLVGVALTNLEDAGSVQLTLPFEPDREGALDMGRAAYCDQRWAHGVKMAKDATVVLSATIDGTPVTLGSVADAWSPDSGCVWGV